MKFIQVKRGYYRTHEIENQTFEVVHDARKMKKGVYATVVPNESIETDLDQIRIKVEDFEYINVDEPVKQVETDEEVMERIGLRFDILDQMTKAAINGDIRAMIVVGPPGVGKSYGVENELEKASTFDVIAGRGIKYEVVKGGMSPLGLYRTLYEHSDDGHVLVFDDIDSIFEDPLSLNLLKAALDSGKRRRISWNSDSSLLRREGIPDRFDFKGSVIFITNIDFDTTRSKKLRGHLDALQSRCHYIDLTMNTVREKILRIKQIHNTGDLFTNYRFQNNEGDEIIDFMIEKQASLREISLRSALKIADLVKVSPIRWKALAENTVMKYSY